MPIDTSAARWRPVHLDYVWQSGFIGAYYKGSGHRRCTAGDLPLGAGIAAPTRDQAVPTLPRAKTAIKANRATFRSTQDFAFSRSQQNYSHAILSLNSSKLPFIYAVPHLTSNVNPPSLIATIRYESRPPFPIDYK